MGIIRDDIRSKKLYKSGKVTSAYKDSIGDIVVPTAIAQELNGIVDITETINDPGIYHVNKHLIKQLEEMRLDIEELHAFIKDAFGKDSAQAASQGSKGDAGPQGLVGVTGSQGNPGVQGPKGSTGSTGLTGSAGPKGADGNSHLGNVNSIAINSKTGKLEVSIGKIVYKFNAVK